MVPWAHPSPHHKQHLDRFNRFSTVHDYVTYKPRSRNIGSNGLHVLHSVRAIRPSNTNAHCQQSKDRQIDEGDVPLQHVASPGKHFIPLSLSTCMNSFLTTFHPDPCVLPIQISLPDQPVLLATFPLGPFLCLHLPLRTLYLHTFVLSIAYPPLKAT